MSGGNSSSMSKTRWPLPRAWWRCSERPPASRTPLPMPKPPPIGHLGFLPPAISPPATSFACCGSSTWLAWALPRAAPPLCESRLLKSRHRASRPPTSGSTVSMPVPWVMPVTRRRLPKFSWPCRTATTTSNSKSTTSIACAKSKTVGPRTKKKLCFRGFRKRGTGAAGPASPASSTACSTPRSSSSRRTSSRWPTAQYPTSRPSKTSKPRGLFAEAAATFEPVSSPGRTTRRG